MRHMNTGVAVMTADYSGSSRASTVPFGILNVFCECGVSEVEAWSCEMFCKHSEGFANGDAMLGKSGNDEELCMEAVL